MITFSTCFYYINSKFDINTYINWAKNLLLNVNNFNLVVYTNKESYKFIENIIDKNNKKIKVIIKPFEEFNFYKYKDLWIENQKKNNTLSHVDWKLILLWCEKICFVKNTFLNVNNYFNEYNDFFGWCDIGYFRLSENGDIPPFLINQWPNNNKINNLNPNKIYYAKVNLDNNYFTHQKYNIRNIDTNISLFKELNPNDYHIAGGFFIINKINILWWENTFLKMVKLYFENNFLIKDDQQIILSCVYFNQFNEDKFEFIQENINLFNPWFVFQRFLL